MLFEYVNAFDAICTSRPSKTCKSPYVADVIIEESTELVHAPALGMDGYISPNKSVLIQKIPKPTGACKYAIVAAYDSEKKIYVGANPLHANKVFHEACKRQLFADDFGHIDSIVPEYTHGNSRFDFFVNDSVYVEVKSVLIADGDTAYFPVGNRKKGTISERANKHLTELTTLAKEGQSCAVVFMVMRNDVTEFSPNPKDQIFCNCLKFAYDAGVQVLVFQFEVSTKGIEYVTKLQYTGFE
tara:strand:+ start:540 stop:1265 length:726 start_codon:yes stop_codon:yes gene_type:complete